MNRVIVAVDRRCRSLSVTRREFAYQASFVWILIHLLGFSG